jgi:ParB family chromosome partitioning protein
MAQDRRIVYTNPRDLLPSRENVRSDPGDLAGLAETIREHGILQPLGVMREGDAYRIVYGNRRRDAAIVVGLDRVPCLVLDDVDAQSAVVQQVLENLQRLDLNDLDKSRAFEGLLAHMAERGTGQGEALDAMARTLGLSARQIQRYLRLRQLSPGVQQLIAQGELGVTHAQHLVDIDPIERQEAIAQLVVEESLSAAELARLVAALQHNVNIEPRLALEALRRGERIAVVETRPREPLPRFGQPPAAEKSLDENEELEGDEGEKNKREGPREEQVPWEVFEGEDATLRRGGSTEAAGYGAMEPTTRDGNRVRKIHSLDSFMDEIQRLAACLQEGDLQRLLEEDEAGQVKIRLAARQLRFLADAVASLAKE